MKIGLFTDSHYCRAEVLCNTRRPSLSLGKIKEAMDAFSLARVDLCICLGDLTDHKEGDTKEAVTSCFFEAMELIKSYNIPFFLIPGNHDYLMMRAEELYTALSQEPLPFTLGLDRLNIIFLDANYREWGERFDTAGVLWTDSNLPTYEVEYLKRTLEHSKKECIIMLHENLDPNVEEHHIVKNAAEIREILEASGKVRTVIQGHFHEGADSVVNGIRYITLPAMCEGEENSYRIIDL